MAARYDVDITTNLSGLVLPFSFRLTRFRPNKVENKETTVSSTIQASVIHVARISSDTPFEIVVPGKTYISDYRLSAGELKGVPFSYVLDSNSIPGVSQIQQSGLFKNKIKSINDAAPSPYLRWAMLAVVLIPSAILIIFLRNLTRAKKPPGGILS